MSLRPTARLLAFSAVLAGSALLPTAVSASAQPFNGPLMSTTCSYDQVKAAMAVEMPEAITRLDENPERAAKLTQFLALPVAERQQKVQERLDANPDARARMEEKRNSPEGQQKMAQLTRVADTCKNY